MNRTLKIALILVTSSFMISCAVARRGSGGGGRGGGGGRSFSGRSFGGGGGGRSFGGARFSGARFSTARPQVRGTGRPAFQQSMRMAPSRRIGSQQAFGRPGTTQRMSPIRYRQIRPIQRGPTFDRSRLVKPSIGRPARYKPGFRRVTSGKSLARRPQNALNQKQLRNLRNFRRNWRNPNWRWGHPGHWWRRHWWLYSPWWWWGFAWDPWWAYEIEPIVVVDYDDEEGTDEEDERQLQQRVRQLNQKIEQMYQGLSAQARAMNELIDQFNKVERKFEKVKGE